MWLAGQQVQDGLQKNIDSVATNQNDRMNNMLRYGYDGNTSARSKRYLNSYLISHNIIFKEFIDSFTSISVNEGK